MVRLYPLRQKTMTEIADNLWTYISIFGPPKSIISDQGTEFVNNVVDSLLKKFGIERSVTSAYNPQTNGCCERANQTIISVLRKHAEGDPLRWPEWLRFIEFSYNTRVHSSTKYSPHEILFGLKTNRFIDYSSLDKVSDELDLYNRTIQLKELEESIRPDTLDNIHLAQEKQKNDQNKRNNPITESLKPGTLVMLKVEGLKGKLENRYHGKFTILKQTSHGNYRLLNALNNEMKETYPIHKLKIIQEDEEKPTESVEIEKILNKRVNNTTNKVEYLVKWVDFDDTHNEWLSEEYFDELKLINEYNKSIHRLNQPEITSPIEKPKRGRPPRSAIKVTNMLSIILISFLISSVCGIDDFVFDVDDEFTYCDRSEARMVDLENNCITRQSNYKTQFPDIDTHEKIIKCKPYTKNCVNGQDMDTTVVRNTLRKQHNDTLELQYGTKIIPTNLYVLHKLQNVVSGIAYECRIIEQKVILKTDIFARRTPPIKTEKSIFMNRERCLELVKIKNCENSVMKCEPTGCFTQDPDYSTLYGGRWTEEIITTFKCSYFQREIIGKRTDVNLFTDEDGKCRALDGVCILSDSIIVWDPNNVTHACPYEYVSFYPFERLDSDIMQSETHSLALQLIKKELTCTNTDHPFPIYTTLEGLYLAKLSEMNNTLVVQTKIPNLMLSNMLVLADIDNSRLNQYRTYKELNQRNCYNTLNLINSIANSRHDEFFKIHDVDGNELILYTNRGQVYIPNCKTINKIQVIKKVTKCFKHIAIIYNMTEPLYLTKDKILRKTSIEANCNDFNYNTYIILKNDSFAIKKTAQINNAVIELVSHKRTYQQINIVKFNISTLNFQHSHGIVYNIDFSDYKNKGLKYLDGRFYLPDPYKTDNMNTVKTAIDDIINSIDNNWHYFKIISITIIILVIFTIITIISFSFFKRIKSFRKKRNHNKRRQTERSVNLIKSFLPNPISKQVNITTINETEFNEIDPVTEKIFQNIHDNNIRSIIKNSKQ